MSGGWSIQLHQRKGLKTITLENSKGQYTNLKKALLINGLVLVILTAYYLLFTLIDISCPIKAILGFDCPTCNSTTALLSLLRLDFKGYFALQPFAVPLCMVALLQLNRFLFKHKLWIDIVTIVVAVSNFIYYLIRMLT